MWQSEERTKAKARLCIGEHRDPDPKDGSLQPEASTATKFSFMTLFFLAGQFGWRLSAGDVQAAFLNGHEARRNLCFSQPSRGLPGGTWCFDRGHQRRCRFNNQPITLVGEIIS